jgi:mycoredoxin
MYSTSWCADCYRAKQFFKEYNIDYLEINIEQNPEAATLVEELNHGNRSVPTILVDYASDKEDQDSTTKVLVEPSRQELEEFFTPHEK